MGGAGDYVRGVAQPLPAAGVDPAADAATAFRDAAPSPAIAVRVEVVLVTLRHGRLSAFLGERADPPHRGAWEVPGGLVRPHEDLDDAARRELLDTTGLDAFPWHLEQLRTYGAPGRDPRWRVVSVAYLALMPDVATPEASDDRSAARFWTIDDLWSGDAPELAFDHDHIVTDAVERARSKLEYTSLATTFVEQPFTIAELRRVYEAVWGVELHAANFRRKVLSTPGLVVPTGEERATGRAWAELYRRGDPTALHPPILRPSPPPDPTA